MRTISKPIYEDELVKNMTLEIWYDVTNTNPNSIYIPINICLEGYNRYKLCAFINSDCFVCFIKRSLFPKIHVEKSKELFTSKNS